MATRRPLVRIAGRTRQLPEGDTILGAGGSAWGVPGVPTLLAPIGGASATGKEFTVGGYSHPSGVPKFCAQVQRARDAAFTTGVELSALGMNATNVVAMPKGPVDEQLYYWRARHVDQFGGASDWSAAQSYRQLAAEIVATGSAGGTEGTYTITLSSPAQPGDIILLAAKGNTADAVLPAGFSTLEYASSGRYVLAAMELTSGTSTVGPLSKTMNAVAVVVRGGELARISWVPWVEFPSGSPSSFTMPANSAGKSCIFIAFDRSQNTANFGVPTGWNKLVSANYTYFSTIAAYSLAVSGSSISVTRSSSLYSLGGITISLG